MKICVAQTEAERGNIQRNIENHLEWIELAITEKSDLILFPELSLTGYEPVLAKELATQQNDARLEQFQEISDANQITIGIGLPTISDAGILISMILFDPGQGRKIYSKQKLHLDERPYFVQDNHQIILTIKSKKIAPAICYESLQPEHAESAHRLGAEIYIASVAKSQKGVEKAFRHFPKIAKKFSMPVLMSNSIGFCDNFQSVGQSAIWNNQGELLKKLDSDKEGLLLVDTETQQVMVKEKVVGNT